MCDITRDLQTPPFCKLPHFLRLLPPLEHEVLYARPQTFVTRHSVIQMRSRPNDSAHASCYSPIQELCLCWPSDWTLPAPGITSPVTYPAAEMT